MPSDFERENFISVVVVHVFNLSMNGVCDLESEHEDEGRDCDEEKEGSYPHCCVGILLLTLEQEELTAEVVCT